MDDPEAPARAITARRKALMLSQEELAARSGVSLTTVRDVESGRRTSLRASNSRALATALGWTPDSIERILAGHEPSELPATRDDEDLRAIVAELRRRLTDVERRLAGDPPTAPPEAPERQGRSA